MPSNDTKSVGRYTIKGLDTQSRVINTEKRKTKWQPLHVRPSNGLSWLRNTKDLRNDYGTNMLPSNQYKEMNCGQVALKQAIEITPIPI